MTRDNNDSDNEKCKKINHFWKFLYSDLEFPLNVIECQDKKQGETLI